MPEGHTIHRLARDQGRDLAGGPVAVSSPQGRFAAGAARIDGRRLDRIEAYGKHLFYWWAGDEVLHVHLGLFGKFRRQPAPPPEPFGEVRLRMVGAEHAWDLSGATACELFTPDDRDRIVARLGPDPLRRDADASRFVGRVTRSRAPIGGLLLDQAVVAGIGNVYRAEILLLHGIHPLREGRSLSTEEAAAIWDTTAALLRQGVRRNRIEPRNAYKREDCGLCGGPLEVLTLGARRTWACPACQPRPR